MQLLVLSQYSVVSVLPPSLVGLVLTQRLSIMRFIYPDAASHNIDNQPLKQIH